MRLQELGELGLIARIRKLGLVRPEGVVRGIGDDAAVFRIGAGRVVVVTTDLLLEGVHFRLGRSDPFRLGAKSLAASLSDIAAMGARPREAFLGLAAPGGLEVEVLERFLLGFDEEARRHGVNLLGGDCSASEAGLAVAVTVVGDGEEDRLVYRSGGRPGDVLCVTGTLGDSAAGLMLLERHLAVDGEERRALIEAHERPQACVAEGEWLAATGAVSAMIDLSDGVVTDLGHLLAESGGLGATLDSAALPRSRTLEALCREIGSDPLEFALGGGEDYRLLLALQPGPVDEVRRAFRERFARPLFAIGRIDAEPGLRLRRAGAVETLKRRGHEHWRGPAGESPEPTEPAAKQGTAWRLCRR